MTALDPVVAPPGTAGPDELLSVWLPSNDDPVRPLMTLSTVSSSGYPDARTVLLSEYDDTGLYFHTDSRSRKVADVTANPRVALTLLWPGRQLVVQGDASRSSAEEQAWAYEHRSRYLQQLSWLNTASFAALDGAARLSQWAEFGHEHPSLTPPPTWTGFVVRPVRLTFWEGDPDTASRRTEYRRDADGAWTASLLAG
ncbi:pyridoxine/pyridoxamine 5'-phosphate oxidase [Herbiconiux flava]|uniref:Pyridoxamine 5'-phosphate oxidase n=1 Tax=Herbiconiux flava TaxID=881268 RepID=A0A852STJ0_9MICO|nr:pyridoxamine 5'-phosphate oxidase family protein [Herbiconiux flava]NYD71950.1 pyridoxamine 5'-phosphate oxidase [Herbiconiux flava]GLK18087.1 pyridoxine/pyridoxamine 5'-phosphate oxidase [Herbiconiux flava]